MSDAALVKVDQARVLLAEARDLSVPTKLRAMASGALAILKKRRDSSLESISHALEVKVRCERRIGELLREQVESGKRQARGGDRKSNYHNDRLIPTLEEQGFTYNQSSRFQRLSRIDEKDFVRHVAEKKEAGEEWTTSSVMRLSPKKEKASKEDKADDSEWWEGQEGKWKPCPMCKGSGELFFKTQGEKT